MQTRAMCKKERAFELLASPLSSGMSPRKRRNLSAYGWAIHREMLPTFICGIERIFYLSIRRFIAN